VDLRQLTYFCAVAEYRSFSKAAGAVFVAQPAMSQQIHRLELELAVELFDRSSRPIRLTPVGEHLFPQAREILASVARAKVEAQEFAGEFRGRIVIGAMQYLASSELPDLLVAYRKRHPAVELQLRMANTGQLLEMLQAGDIDVAYIHSDGMHPPDELVVEHLREEELVIIVDRADSLSDLPSVRVEDLFDYPFITFRKGASTHDALLQLFASAGRQPRTGFESADLATAFALVKRGLGLALVPRSVASLDPAVGVLSVAPQPVTRNVAQIWRKDRPHSLALASFVREARSMLAPTKYLLR
jgi:DNA-binding transcriptional LysR family regulator